MNIEEIKDSLRTASITGWDPEKSDYIEDVTYLLSIIEQAEKALESIFKYPNTEMKSPEDLGYTYQSLAEEALQAIRK